MDKTELLGKLAFEQFKTQSDYLADKIKHMIVSGEFEDGFIFPNENEFCKILNVSRGTLRDAYKKLDTQGFIERTKQGTFVKCRETIALQGNYSASLELAAGKEMAEFICAFEPEAVRLAAQKMDEEDLRQLELLQAECENCQEDHRALSEANYKFHQFIRIKSGNNLVVSVLTAYYDIFNKQIIDNIYDVLKENADSFRENALAQHRELLQAFRDRNSQQARDIAFAHLQADLEVHMTLGR